MTSLSTKFHWPLEGREDPFSQHTRPEKEIAPLSGIQHTAYPTVTGTSVLGIQFNGGVMLAADTLGSYGSLAKYKDLRRLHKIGPATLLGAGGEYSDLQYILNLLDDLMTEEYCMDDGYQLGSAEIHSYLSRVLYNRRNKFDPLWNQILVAGFNDKKPFLGMVDLQGTSFTDKIIASGYGGYIALPLMRKAWKPDLTEEEAKKLLEDCLRVLFYRDARTINRFQIATVTERGVEISEPYSLETNWEFKSFIKGATYGSW